MPRFIGSYKQASPTLRLPIRRNFQTEPMFLASLDFMDGASHPLHSTGWNCTSPFKFQTVRAKIINLMLKTNYLKINNVHLSKLKKTSLKAFSNHNSPYKYASTLFVFAKVCQSLSLHLETHHHWLDKKPQ